MDYFHYRRGKLWVEEVPITDIINQVSTPCYIYSKATLTRHWQAFAKAFSSQPHTICYAVKANSNIAVLNTFAKLNSGFDIVSKGELCRVIKAGGSTDRVIFSGVGKQPDEIAFALKNNIMSFNVESEQELLAINEIAKHENTQAKISIRINPDVDPQSHPYISTGLKENKFGIEYQLAPELYQQAAQLPHIKIFGIACHIGSQITSLDPFTQALTRLKALMDNLSTFNVNINCINIGGGLGVKYQNESPPSPREYADAILKSGLPDCHLIIEPGRAIAANAGVFITKVLYLKETSKKRFCIIDGGMNDLLRPTLYSAWHDIIPVIPSNNTTKKVYDVVGPICESGDFITKNHSLAVKPDDLLAVKSAGAYGFTMSSNYNSRPRPCEIMVDNNKFDIIRKRETIDDLFANESIPC